MTKEERWLFDGMVLRSQLLVILSRRVRARTHTALCRPRTLRFVWFRLPRAKFLDIPSNFGPATASFVMSGCAA